jgi:acyl-coenzyme A thioesterase PaaI-like protein
LPCKEQAYIPSVPIGFVNGGYTMRSLNTIAGLILDHVAYSGTEDGR